MKCIFVSRSQLYEKCLHSQDRSSECPFLTICQTCVIIIIFQPILTIFITSCHIDQKSVQIQILISTQTL